VPAEAVTYWQTLLDKVVASPAWKRDYIDKLAVTPHVKKGDEAVQFLAGMEQLYRKTLRQLGVISS
jgi:tripartite-type tricarboxylate transporter receptor subunit TctC